MPNNEAYRSAARRLYPEVEVEEDADVSTAPDGAFVAAWVWVAMTLPRSLKRELYEYDGR